MNIVRESGFRFPELPEALQLTISIWQFDKLIEMENRLSGFLNNDTLKKRISLWQGLRSY
jgi:hypothetical protein